MGRLFWKFFLAFWLAQVITAAVVGVAVWVMHSAEGNPAERFAGRPPASMPAFPPEPPSAAAPAGPPPRSGPGPIPLFPILAGTLVSLVFAALLAGYFARPIRTLRDAFEAVAEGALDARADPFMGPRRDELADLGKSFDHMADRLQSMLESQRRLLHDVSHELRSPLARLQAAVDLIQQQPERGAEFIARIQKDVQRMDSLVGELLTLARLDAGMTGSLDNAVDLAEVLNDIVDDAAFEATQKGCHFQLSMPPALMICGDQELLHRAIENVVRNAIRYSPAGAMIHLTATREHECVRLAVADAGPGVAPAELAAIFEPFFRSAAQAADSGYGLGLAITHSVVTAHGGRVFAMNQPAGGLAVVFELPAA